MRPTHLLLALLLAPLPAEARTPREPPVPRHCFAICGGPQGNQQCFQTCRAAWDQLPWREKLAREFRSAERCPVSERRCVTACARGMAPARCTTTCLRSLITCARRAMGLDPARAARCWQARHGQEKRCAGQEGRGGWQCRQEARDAFYGCHRQSAARIAPHTEAYRIVLEIEEAMGSDVEAEPVGPKGRGTRTLPPP